MRKSKSTTQIKERRILEALRDSAEGIIEMDKFYAALYDRRDVALYFPVVAQRDNGRLRPVTEPWPARPYRPDIWLPDYVFIKESPVFIKGNFSEWLENNKLKYKLDPLPGSWMGVPLAARGRVLGVIVAENMQEGAYDAQSLDFFAAIANRAAGAIANNRLVESLRVVNQVGQALTSKVRLDQNEILTLIYEQAGELMNTDNMYIALYYQGTQMLSFPFAIMDGERQYDWPSRRVDLTMGEVEGLTEEVLINKRPLCPLDVEAWFRAKNIEPRVEPVPKSWVGVPLLGEDKVLGIISLQNDEVANLFGPDDIEILQAMAGQAAVALENTRLVDQLNVVNEVGQTLAANIDLDLGEILELVYKQTGRLMDTRNMYIAMYDQDTQTLRFPLAMYDGQREYDWPARKVDLTSEKVQGLTEKVLSTRKFLNPENVEEWYVDKDIKPKVLPVPKSWLGVPIISGERVLGVISLQNDEVAKLYSEDDIEVLQTLAGQAAVAIENARLYENLEERVRERTGEVQELNRQLAALQDIGVKITSRLDLEAVLNTIAENANVFMSADFSTLFSYNPDLEKFELGVRRGKVENKPVMPRKNGFTASTLKGKAAIFVENTEAQELNVELDFIAGKKVRAFAGIPLIAKGLPVGVLYVSFFEPHRFSEEEKQLLNLLASQAAVAIVNAELYENLEERVQERTRQLVDAQQRIADQEAVVTRTMISTDFVHRLNNLAGTIPIWAGQIREHLNAEDIHDDMLDVYLTNIESDTEKLLRAAEQLKLLPEAQSVNIKEILQALVRQARIQALTKIDIDLRCEEELPFVHAVAMELRNALWNVMENGIDAMPDGGTLRVTAESSKDAEGEVFINIEVQDEGIGIPQEITDKIFSPFYSTKEGHMGYGLWRARYIFERMGGNITFESTEGHGTTFIVRLPAAEEVGSDV